MSQSRSLRSLLARATCLVALGATSASAQFPVASGPPIDMGATAPLRIEPAPEVARVPPNQLTQPTTGPQRVRYTLPFLSQTRQQNRTANRYTVARPVYAGRPGVSFAPYSDYYFPRVIGSKEEVRTASPDAPAPVGYRSFARPGNSVFGR